jgi:hypothetical protein
LAAIEGEEDYFPLGEVPLEWLQKRILGVATAEGEYADICSSDWISRLRKSLAAHLSKFGVEDIDAAVLQKTAPRTQTQFVSRIVFYAGFSGIHYLSKCGDDIENWALFELFQIDVKDPETVRVRRTQFRSLTWAIAHGLRILGSWVRPAVAEIFSGTARLLTATD